MGARGFRFVPLVFIAALVAGAAGCAKPKVQVRVDRDRIQSGEDVRVSWTSKDAKEVTINGEAVDKNGSKAYSPNATTTYTAVARRGSKQALDSKTVNVTPRPNRPTIRITADQDAITRGQSTNLRWASTDADRVTITDLGTVPATGSRIVAPAQSTTYTATAAGPGGSESASARVTVTEETPPETRPRTNPPTTAMATIFNQWVQPIFFELDKAELMEESKDRLRRAAGWLNQAPNRSVVFRIEGNCDPRGTEEYNIGLGERRAQAAKEFLTSLGVDASRMQTVSYGKERAQGSDEGSPGQRPSWAYDRRDDFIYVSGGTPPRS
jgi:peptidoglycan-associated lipoprotein